MKKRVKVRTFSMWRTTKTLTGVPVVQDFLLFAFHADLQSDAFRDDTPTLPPSSAPALNWTCDTLREEVSVKKRSLATTVKKAQQPRVWQRPLRTEHLNISRKTHNVSIYSVTSPAYGRSFTHGYLNKDRITQTHTSQTHQNPLMLQVFALFLTF